MRHTDHAGRGEVPRSRRPRSRGFGMVWDTRRDGEFGSHRCRGAHQGRRGEAAGRAARQHRQAPGVGRRGARRCCAGAGVVAGAGAGALVGHFHHNIPKQDVEAVGELLESGDSGLIVVAVNRSARRSSRCWRGPRRRRS